MRLAATRRKRGKSWGNIEVQRLKGFLIGNSHIHILAANESVSDEDKTEINKWIKKEGGAVYRSRK